MNPAIEAFLRADIIWNTIKGAKIVSDNQDVPSNPNSMDNITVRINSHANMFLTTLRAL
tara:strand:+ start:1134 stop:1310 length:177 start_codon:yes stop_codon:yes gene_type:complete